MLRGVVESLGGIRGGFNQDYIAFEGFDPDGMYIRDNNGSAWVDPMSLLRPLEGLFTSVF